ncbi:MAG: twin-arginine translocation signal domain-containing protein, partial [Thermoguttaceae bacterium]|nr:twin-arginine translocation signal domain-containing protein [Thermoguttaceae bacterium]
MQRRDFLTAATAAGLAAVLPTADAQAADAASERRYILLETYFTQNADKRDALVAK